MARRPQSTSPADDLVAALKRGDNAAYRRLLVEEGPALLAVARRFLRSEQDAQDVFQESMVLAFRKIDTFSGHGSLRGWLKRIVINASLAKLRQRKSRNEASIEELMPTFDERGCRIEPHAPPLPTAEAVLADAEAQQQVRDAIESLPNTHRTILLLRDIEGLTTQEAADLLSIEVSAAKVRLHRARSALKKLLEPLRRDGRLG